MAIGNFLIRSILAAGAGHVFGIQGGYVLPCCSRLCRSPLRAVHTIGEGNAGFAATREQIRSRPWIPPGATPGVAVILQKNVTAHSSDCAHAGTVGDTPTLP